MTTLETFRATVEHRADDEYLFYAGFTPDLEHRPREHFDLGPEESVQARLGMYDAVEVGSQSLVQQDFGDRLVLDGTIGTQTTMPFGSPADVSKIVRERKKLLGRDGALTLSPTPVLEPEVPIDNIIAFVEACLQ